MFLNITYSVEKPHSKHFLKIILEILLKILHFEKGGSLCPVFLTKNGRGCYVVIDIKEYERMVAALKLQKALADGERSAEQGGWRSAADVRKKYEV